MEQATQKQRMFSKPWVQSLTGIGVIVVLLGGFIYWRITSAYTYIEMSEVKAPIISIAPEAEGILAEVYVKPGETVTANETIARVGGETLSAKTNGIVISVQNTPGQVFMPGTAVVTMIDPNQLRVVGKVDENKGLADVKVGAPVIFTVDAFGSKQFTGVVDEVSPTSNQTGVVFSISDKRDIKQFEVKVRFDVAAHPEFKNGMSAKMKVYGK